MEKSRFVLPSLEEVRVARRDLKKRVAEFSDRVQGSWPKSLRVSNLELEAEKIKEKLAVIQESISASKQNFKKKIKKYRKEILSGCELWDLGKVVKKLEKTERKVSRLSKEEKKLGKVCSQVKETLELLDRASDVITYLSSYKFMRTVARALEKEFSQSHAPTDEKEYKSSLREEVQSDRVTEDLQNAEKIDDEEERNKEDNTGSQIRDIEECIVDSNDTSADVTEILWTESEITRHRDNSSTNGTQEMNTKTAPTWMKQARAYGGGRYNIKFGKESDARSDLREDWPNASKKRAARESEKLEFISSNREVREERDTKLRIFRVKFKLERNYVPLQPFDPGGLFSSLGLLWGVGNVMKIGDISHVIVSI